MADRPKTTMIARLSLTALAGAALATAGCGGNGDASSESTTIPQPTAAQIAAADLTKVPVAPDRARIDLTTPSFSNPTEVTNRLFPINARLRDTLKTVQPA